MRIIVILFLSVLPFSSFSQRATQAQISWVSLKKAKVLAKEINKPILVYFYKKDCQYCDKMKRETLSDVSVINIINNNFVPVKIDSRTKDTIHYNNKAYGNQQPESSGRYDWRHDFYAEVAAFDRNGTSQSTTPTIALFNPNFEKITIFPGNHPKQLLLRKINKFIN
jgi:thioredoxin-related protein